MCVEHSTEAISFLNVNIHIDQFRGRIWIDLYSKLTDSHDYLHYESTLPDQCRKGLPVSQILRVECICGWEVDSCTRSLSLKYLRRGYPSSKVVDERYGKAKAIPTYIWTDQGEA